MSAGFINEYVREHANEIYPYVTSERKRYLFGAGQQATNCVFLFHLMHVDLHGVLVSHKTVEEFQGLPVFQADSDCVDRKDCAVLIAVHPRLAADITKQLKALGYEDIHTCLDWEGVNDAVKEAVGLDYFRNHGIDVSSGDIRLGQCRFVNPFQEERKYRQMLLGTTFTELIVPGILGQDTYHNRELYEVIEQDFGGVETVFDIGANAGVFAGYAASMGKRVEAFEPARSILPYLRKNVSLYDSIHVEDCAVCERDGFIAFYDKEDYPKYSTVCDPESQEYEQYQVKAVCLDDYISETGLCPQLIRIYVNGAAGRVIEGAQKYISEYRPALFVALEHEEILPLKERIWSCNQEYQLCEWPGYLYFH